VPLPPNGLAWPPAPLATVRPALEQWSAWYEGTPEALTAAYSRTALAPSRPSQYRGGVIGAVARFWWGRPLDDLTQRRDQLHVPIAADLCQASADLLYAEPPTLTLPDGARGATATLDRLEEFVDDGFHTVLASGAEVGAALGGRYHRVTWDRDVVPDRPFLTTVHADAAWPEFRWDRLVAVTFWHVIEANGQTVLRHVERHELDAQGNGLVLHGLYEGTKENLGRAVPLTEHSSTRGLATLVDADGALVDGRTPGLCVEFVPNQRPQRRWRTDHVGKSLGRSDLDGVEPLMDALDEAYSSWMRDIRLGKGRILVAESMLDSMGPGQGASFNLDRDVFVGLPNVLPPREGSGLPVQAEQFAIRVDEHERTVNALVEQILRSAGYSAQTFGEGPEGGAITATEVHSRERRSFLTRDRKVRLERPAVGRLVEKMLSIDAAVFGTQGVVPLRPLVTFGDSVQDSLLSLAQTAAALEQAKAASTETKVRMLHPDWDDTQVGREVAAIRDEQAISLADPTVVVPPGADPAAEEFDPAEQA